MDKHLMDGCPRPKNDRRSVDVLRSDTRLSSDKKMKILLIIYIKIIFLLILMIIFLMNYFLKMIIKK